MPSRMLLALPQFLVKHEWLDVEELFGTTEALARRQPGGFSNEGETLFDALSRTAVDFRGRSRGCEGAPCDLSRFVVGDAGNYTTRDELFSSHPPFRNTLRGIVFELLYGGRGSA